MFGTGARPLAAALCAALLTALAGCASSIGDASSGPQASGAFQPVNDPDVARAADKFSSATKKGDTAYKIGAQDVLEINVFNVSELNRTIAVADNGSINFPLIGEVSTAGKTARQVERDLASRLNAKFVKSPQVSVFVKEYNSQHFTVDGSVKKPGVYPLRDKNTLLQAIAVGGGLDNDSASSNVVVFRQGPGGRAVARFDIDAIRAGQAEDPAIQDGDSIVVDASSGKVFLRYFGKISPVTSLVRPAL